jgi:hypothetical protein
MREIFSKNEGVPGQWLFRTRRSGGVADGVGLSFSPRATPDPA